MHLETEHQHSVSGRTRQLTRAADAVMHKLMRVYALSAADFHLSERENQQFQKIIKTQFQRKRWHQSRDTCMQSCHLSANETEAVDALALRVLHRYADAFYLRRNVMNRCVAGIQGIAQANPYYRYRIGRGMMDVYVNHLTNLTESELRDCGFDEWSAHTLNGFLIGQAVAMRRSRDPEMAFVNPQQINRPVFVHEFEEQLRELRGYWQDVTRRVIAPQAVPYYDSQRQTAKR